MPFSVLHSTLLLKFRKKKKTEAKEEIQEPEKTTKQRRSEDSENQAMPHLKN